MGLKKRLIIFATIQLFTFLAMCRGAETVAQGEWKNIPKGYEYKSKGFSCRILPDGRIIGLAHNGLPIAKEIYFRGGCKGNPGQKNPFFHQNKARETVPLAVCKTDKDSVTLQKSFIIEDKVMPDAAEGEIYIMLCPDYIEIETNITLLQPMKSHSNIFMTHVRLPEDTYSGKGYNLFPVRSSGTRGVMPFKQQKAGKLRTPLLYKWDVSLKTGAISFTGDEKTIFRFCDTPGWGGKFSMHVQPRVAWFSHPVLNEAGKNIRWILRIHFSPHAQ